jgi:hypothetical protein
MGKALDRGHRSKDPDLDTTTAIYGNMLLGKATGDRSIAFPELLARSRLDFTLGSLHAIDDYLRQVRAQQDGLAGVIYLNTVVAVACYLGEVIRRGTPEGECQWLRAPPASQDTSHTGINLGDFADIVLGAKGSDQSLRLTRVVARIVGSNGRQSSTHEYAVAAMKLIWVSATAAPQ